MKLNADQTRNLIFGAEDSFVSTMGVLFGLASNSNFTTSNVLTVGIVLVMVEAFSMGAGAFLSEQSIKDANKRSSYNPIKDGILMLSAYIFSGILLLLPFAFFENHTAKYLSLIVSLVGLFLLGFLPGKSLKSAMRMVVVAGFAAIFGYFVGMIFND